MTELNPQARDAILEHVMRTKQLVHDATSFMNELQVQQQQYVCLNWLWHFGIPTHVPLPPSAISYRELANNVKVPEGTLRAVVRMAITMNFLCETGDGNVSHNHLSASFVENPHLRTWILHLFKQTVPLMGGMIRATEKYGDTAKVNETAYNIVKDTDLSFFEHLNSEPELEIEFDAYMKSQAIVHRSVSVEYLLQGFDWACVSDEAIVVDVGGGSGSASIAVAKAYPKLRFVVQDQPIPISNGRAIVAALPTDISQRIHLEEYDFFKPQPVKEADVYLLRMIIHDWPDAEASKILKQVVHSMKPSSRILIMDMVIPEPDSGSRLFEASLRQKDLSMRLAFNAKERELSDWKKLINSVDPRLAIRNIKRPDGCQHSVIEIGFGGNDAALNGVKTNGVNGH